MSKRAFLTNIFQALKSKKIDFVVLRKHDLIPDQSSIDEDVDVFVRPDQRRDAQSILKSFGFESFTDSIVKNIYLYGAFPHEHFIHQKEDVHLDVVHSLAYRSTNQKEWIPVSDVMQRSMMDNRICEDQPWVYRPAPVDEFVHIVCHCLLDKREVKPHYAKRLKALTRNIDEDRVEEQLNEVFYKFTPRLFDLIKQDRPQRLFQEYVGFKGY